MSGIPTIPDDVRTVINTVARYHGLVPETMLSSSRERMCVQARRICVGILRQKYPFATNTQIGGYLGRDHTWITYSLRELAIARNEHPDFDEEIRCLEDAVLGNLKKVSGRSQ